MDRERVVYVIEYNEPGSDRWRYAGCNSWLDFAEEQRALFARNYPEVTYRVTRYVPDPTEHKRPEQEGSTDK